MTMANCVSANLHARNYRPYRCEDKAQRVALLWFSLPESEPQSEKC